MTLKDFDATFQSELQDPEFATHYIQAALDDSYETGDIGIFLVALREVAQANRAVTRAAKRARVARPSLYKTLSETGNPQFDTIFSLLPEMGLRLRVEALETKRKVAPVKRRKPPVAV